MRYEKSKFEEIVLKSFTLSEVARNLGLEPSKGNRDTIKKYIKLYNIDTQHFNFVSKQTGINKKLDFKDILVENSTYCRKSLKQRLYKEGLKEKKCEDCGQDEMWRGKKISLILDHINGVSDDNRLENLRILCPNCNAALETNCGKNIKTLNYKTINYCIDCNVVIHKKAKRCSKCDHIKQRKTERPEYEELLKDINELGYVATGKKYNVSDNTIRKWLKNLQNT
jgi:hypothetical protein